MLGAVNSENVPNADFMAKFTLAVQGGGKPEATMISSVRLPDMVSCATQNLRRLPGGGDQADRSVEKPLRLWYARRRWR